MRTTLDGARAAVQAAERVAACAELEPEADTLSWHDLQDWPDWAQLDAASLRALAWRCAARWQGAAIRRSIDGRWLQAAAGRVGEGLLRDLLAEPETAGATAPALPAIERLDETWQQLGLALLQASLRGPALRAAVRGVMRQRGVELPADEALDAAHARQVVARARAAVPGALS